MTAFLAIGLGAAIGAWLRWGLGLWLNPVFPTTPLGTLAANLIGGYVIGLSIAWFAEHPGLPPEGQRPGTSQPRASKPPGERRPGSADNGTV